MRGKIISTVDCENVYKDILLEYVTEPATFRSNHRPFVWKLIQDNVSHAKIVNRSGPVPATVSSSGIEKDILDVALDNRDSELKILMKAAKILINNVQSFEKSRQFEFPNSLIPKVEDVTPQVYTFFKLLLSDESFRLKLH